MATRDEDEANMSADSLNALISHARTMNVRGSPSATSTPHRRRGRARDRGRGRGRGALPRGRGRPRQLVTTFNRDVWLLNDLEMTRRAVPRGYDPEARQQSRLVTMELTPSLTAEDLIHRVEDVFELQGNVSQMAIVRHGNGRQPARGNGRWAHVDTMDGPALLRHTGRLYFVQEENVSRVEDEEEAEEEVGGEEQEQEEVEQLEVQEEERVEEENEEMEEDQLVDEGDRQVEEEEQQVREEEEEQQVQEGEEEQQVQEEEEEQQVREEEEEQQVREGEEEQQVQEEEEEQQVQEEEQEEGQQLQEEHQLEGAVISDDSADDELPDMTPPHNDNLDYPEHIRIFSLALVLRDNQRMPHLLCDPLDQAQIMCAWSALPLLVLVMPHLGLDNHLLRLVLLIPTRYLLWVCNTNWSVSRNVPQEFRGLSILRPRSAGDHRHTHTQWTGNNILQEDFLAHVEETTQQCQTIREERAHIEQRRAIIRQQDLAYEESLLQDRRRSQHQQHSQQPQQQQSEGTQENISTNELRRRRMAFYASQEGPSPPGPSQPGPSQPGPPQPGPSGPGPYHPGPSQPSQSSTHPYNRHDYRHAYRTRRRADMRHRQNQHREEHN